MHLQHELDDRSNAVFRFARVYCGAVRLNSGILGKMSPRTDGWLVWELIIARPHTRRQVDRRTHERTHGHQRHYGHKTIGWTERIMAAVATSLNCKLLCS